MTRGAPGRQNLTSFLDDLARHPAETAFVLRTPYRRDAWTAGEIRNAAACLALHLRRGGVTPGERVLLEGPDGPAWVAGFFGIVAAGGIVVPLEHPSPHGFAARVAERTSARAAVVSDAAAAALEGRVVLRLPLTRVEPWRAQASAGFEPHRGAPEDTAEIVFTSGTTAEPKGVELSHRNLLASLEGIEAGFRKRERWLKPLLPMRFLCVVPLSHLFGQSLGIFVPILMRSAAIFPSSPQPSRIARWIRSERPIAVVTVPRVLASLRASTRREVERSGRLQALERALAKSARRGFVRRSLASRPVRAVLGWRTWVFVSGGAALDREVEAFWRGLGFLVVQGYGMTEAAPVISVQNPLDGSAQTLGRPVRDVEVRLAQDGEVLVRGPNVMKGYWNDPAATRAALDDGWLRTGDLAERDGEGRLFFTGRKKDVIVLGGGKNVHPTDVEAALRAVAGVRDAVVFALPGTSGDEVHAAVLLDDPGATVESIRRAANARLEPYQALRRVLAWDDADFPRTSTGKVKRREVAAAARIVGSQRDGSLRAGAAEGGPGANPRVASALARLRSDLASAPAAEARLARDLGLDSLDVLELVSILEDENDVALDDDALTGDVTVGKLEGLVAPELHEPSARVRMPRWNRSLPVRALRGAVWTALLRPLFAFFVRLHVSGREGVAREAGPFLVVANHSSMLDAPAVMAALPRRLRARLHPAMAIETLPAHFEPGRHGVVAKLRSALAYATAATLFGAYPMPQSRGFRPSLEYTGELLGDGFSPLVFPEGRMSRTGVMLPFKSGIGLLAAETRAAVLPVALSGLHLLLPVDGRWPKRGAARATIGRPFRPADDGADPATVARRIEAAVRALAP